MRSEPLFFQKNCLKQSAWELGNWWKAEMPSPICFQVQSRFCSNQAVARKPEGVFISTNARNTHVAGATVNISHRVNYPYTKCMMLQVKQGSCKSNLPSMGEQRFERKVGSVNYCIMDAIMSCIIRLYLLHLIVSLASSECSRLPKIPSSEKIHDAGRKSLHCTNLKQDTCWLMLSSTSKSLIRQGLQWWFCFCGYLGIRAFFDLFHTYCRYLTSFFGRFSIVFSFRLIPIVNCCCTGFSRTFQ